ncbi:MAG: Na+/H+ antiporter [Alphaproteobacteria bacterium]|nr:Na+/H+ antiporter [Alphaproteobacteria bacterium]
MHAPLIFIGALIAIAALALVAKRISLSYPIAFIFGGIGLALIPGLPAILIAPEMILVIFLPPLLMEAAYFTSLRDFRFNLRPILLLAFGLVFMTSAVVAAVVVALIPSATWALGFVIGAIVSPPDAVAATSVIKHLRVPKRIISVLEGESLVNDATGLVIYKFAVAAVVTGMFSLQHAALEFLWMASAGIGIGLGIGHVYMCMFPRIRDRSVEILSTFILPYAVYILAELADASGVLAVVAAGLTVGWHAPERFSSSLRLAAGTVWEMVVFLLNGLVFLLIGLQFPAILEGISRYEPAALMGYAAAICTAVILTRFAWVFSATYLPRLLFPSIRLRDTTPSWQNIFLVAWTGMRGVVSLATALALPFAVADGSAFPHRDLVLFLAVMVIGFTLIVQGLPLPWLIRRLMLTYNPEIRFEEWQARVSSAREALIKLASVEVDSPLKTSALMRIRSHYEDRIASLGDGPNTPLFPSEEPDGDSHPALVAERDIWTQVLDAERKMIISLRKSFQINDDIMHDLLRDLDRMAMRFRIQE